MDSLARAAPSRVPPAGAPCPGRRGALTLGSDRAAAAGPGGTTGTPSLPVRSGGGVLWSAQIAFSPGRPRPGPTRRGDGQQNTGTGAAEGGCLSTES